MAYCVFHLCRSNNNVLFQKFTKHRDILFSFQLTIYIKINNITIYRRKPHIEYLLNSHPTFSTNDIAITSTNDRRYTVLSSLVSFLSLRECNFGVNEDIVLDIR